MEPKRISIDAEQLAKDAHWMAEIMNERHLKLTGKQLEYFVQRAIEKQVPDIQNLLKKGD